MPDLTSRLLRIALVVFLFVLAVTVMRLTVVVSVPVALAGFTLMLALPLQRKLQARGMRTGPANLLTLLAVGCVTGLFLLLLYWLGQAVVTQAPEYGPQLDRLLTQWRNRLADLQEAVPGPEKNFEVEAVVDWLVGWVPSVFRSVYGLLGLIVLTATFLVLGLIESRGLADRVRGALRPATARLVLDATQEWASVMSRYMLVRTVISALTGLATWVFTWAVGLEFAGVWGMLTFLLNFIPMLGSIVAVVPPVLIALLHPEPWMGFTVLAGLTCIQLFLGNYVDPRMEGRILSVSPFVLFLSVIFWGWIWGIPGALMGIPITVGFVIFCKYGKSTRWLARLLEHDPNHGRHAEEPQGEQPQDARQ
ncbi:putative PurR-regulated permease PerM [Hydrogenophaga palleronii]|uniref:PurR-regulated permease PerM n=1 Tax=Hydrogenophaga palleronii TaxID=65655 RepID=A0ABU1WMT6_9BURK|nr:AI-2E family transporter [Hydrogenophaga palleronii]MDR7150620.1 putative PurR-regulated permease PerM [Hydrogenophaga palleronii]